MLRFSQIFHRRGMHCGAIGCSAFQTVLSTRKVQVSNGLAALIWLFRTRHLCPTFHRWALRLMKYDTDLRWREGFQHVFLDALFFSGVPNTHDEQACIGDAFPDDFTSPTETYAACTQGPRLEGRLLSDLPTVEPHIAATKSTSETDTNLRSLLLELQPATSGELHDQTPAVCRSSSRRFPSVRFCSPGDKRTGFPSNLPFVDPSPPPPLTAVQTPAT